MADTTKTNSTAAGVEAAAAPETLEPVTYEFLQKAHESKAAEVYDAIARIGGFGAVGADFVGGRPALDLNGLSVTAKDKLNPEKAEDATRRLAEIKKLLK